MPDSIELGPLARWKRELLSLRSLAQQDGRPLYRYRLTEAEFGALETLLRDNLRTRTPLVRFDLKNITGQAGFPALFVLYGAEWWRRRYDGSGFSWDPILEDLGADPRQWPAGERSDCVRSGLRAWGLQLRESGGLRFLGTVAVQGGLPLRLLAEARGGIGQVLRRVLQLSSNGHVSQSDLQSWIASL